MAISYEYFVDGIALTSVSLFGLIGTLLSIRVLLRPNLRNSFSTLLAGLAACDANFLACAVLIIGLPKAWDWYRRNLSVYLIPVVYGMIGVARTGSVYFTMAVTLERYFAIVRPLSQFRVKKYLLPGTIIFAVVYNIPKFFELERYVFAYTNETVVGSTALRKDPLYTTIYVMWMKLIILELVPYITIIVLNTLIVRQILQSYQFRKTFRVWTGSENCASATNPAIPGPPNNVVATSASIHRSVSILSSRYETPSPPLTIRSGKTVGNVVVNETNECMLMQQKPKLRKNESQESSPIMAVVNLGPCSQVIEETVLQDPQDIECEDSINPSGVAGMDGEAEGIASLPTNEPDTKRSALTRKKFWSCTAAAEGGASVSSSTISGVASSHPTQVAQATERQQEFSLGLTLVAISILFIVCQSVKLIPDVYELVLCEKEANAECASTAFIDQLISLANLLSCINSSANFLVYMLRGKKFRDAFLVTYGCKIRGRQGRQGFLMRQQTTRTSIIGQHNVTEVQPFRSNSVSEINH